MKTLKILLFLCATSLLHGSWFDWFYHTVPSKATQFDCPYKCGKWGTESIRTVEWQAILFLWEVDRLSYALQEKPFPYPSPPLNVEDPWYQHFYNSRIILSIPSHISALSGCKRHHHPYRDLVFCFCKEYKPAPIEWITLHHAEDSNNNLAGRCFTRYSDGYLDYFDFCIESSLSLRNLEAIIDCFHSQFDDGISYYREQKFCDLLEPIPIILG
ncbi:MAG: hypothetical protein KDK76_00775 [Chlamydiia bacterium]|nr:hypothetical protein [Chlamydiia bacterium]